MFISVTFTAVVLQSDYTKQALPLGETTKNNATEAEPFTKHRN
jgi:hypothetical protein